MINSLTGTIAGVEEGMVFLETDGGIEWAIQVSATTQRALPQTGSTVRMLTYLHHRDDQMGLFGFRTPEERTVFLDLMKVGGIGTRQALRILSGMTVEELVRSLDAEDVDALARIPGLGKKTAQKMLLALRGKLSLTTQAETETRDEIVDALVDMGFDRAKAVTAVRSVRSEIDTAGASGEQRRSGDEVASSEGELLRRAIVRLSAQQ